MKLLAIVVFYYPDNSSYDNLDKFIPWTDGLFLWDNTPYSNNKLLIENIHKKYKNKEIYLRIPEKNYGLSYVYNKGIQYAKSNGYTHVLLMDQDSQWMKFDNFRLTCEKIFNINKNCIVGPVVFDSNTINDIPTNNNEITIERADFVINSGSIYPISVFDTIGMYSERFIVDSTDLEICLRAQSHRIPVLKVSGSGFIMQSFGSPRFYKFFGKQLRTDNNSPFRNYGTLRNLILIRRIYPESPCNYWFILKYYVIVRSIGILLVEKNKFKKLYAIINGILHGLFTVKSINDRYSKA